MNKIYRKVWNKHRGIFMVVAETARSQGKGASTVGFLVASVLLSVGASAYAQSPGANALPNGFQLSAGAALASQVGNTLNIQQSSQRAAIDWQGFSVGSNSTVNFVQPNASAVVLNRVVGNEQSVISGALNANGQVFLLNSNGVLFTQGAQVNVGGIVASTLDLGNADFMAGNHSFKAHANKASVINFGTINAADGGYVALLGNQVSNQGVISARLGTAALAAGDMIRLNFNGNSLVGVNIQQGTLDALVENKQAILANGGQVILTAQGLDTVLNSMVNNTGEIRAQTIANQGGKIVLLGDMHNGTVNVGGTLDASAPHGGDGGFVETSAAHVKVSDAARVSTAANMGLAGTWLIDPKDFTIASGNAGSITAGTPSGDISGATLTQALVSGNVTILSSQGSSAAGSGNINVNDDVTWSANTLTLTAANNINVNAVMTASGSASLALNPATANGGNAAIDTGALLMGMNGSGFTGRVDFSSSGTLKINGVTYTVIRSLGSHEADTTPGTLQGMQGNLAGNYVLGANIEASATSGWNGGSGFTPIGSDSSAFWGSFDGLGHTINGLTVHQTADYVGLFGYNLWTVKNVGLLGASVSGSHSVGGLVGYNSGSIRNSFATGTVSGSERVGGLAGSNTGEISNSYATAAVAGSRWVGGLVGISEYSINNSYATGSVTGREGVGGLVGDLNSGTIRNSYSSGPVYGAANGTEIGGLIGSFNQDTILSNSFYDMDHVQMYTNGNTVTASNMNSKGGLYAAQYQDWIAHGLSLNIGDYAASLSRVGSTDSYMVTGVQGLKDMLGFSQSNQSGLTFKLGADMDLSGHPELWVPYFTQTFDGNGHVISNLRVQSSGMNQQVGFIGLLGSAGSVQNLGLTNVDIHGVSQVGGLVGNNRYGTIANSYATGAVTGNGSVGGLVGDNSGSISTSHATGSVSGDLIVGGLVGLNQGGISSSYATVAVTGSDYVGGLVGRNFNSNISNSYATGSVTGSESVGGLVGQALGGTLSNSYSSGPVYGAANGTSIGGLIGYLSPSTILSNSFYDMDHVQMYTNGNTTTASNMNSNGGLYAAQYQDWISHGLSLDIGNYASYLSRVGSTDTYMVTGVQGLKDMLGFSQSNQSGLTFKLGADVDLSGHPELWVPYFTQTFDGNGHVISNLSVQSSSMNQRVGFIGFLGSAGAVQNLGLTNVDIHGNSEVGGLVGNNRYGTIANSYVRGAVTGNRVVGGLVGYGNHATISNSHASGTVTGNQVVGGLVGYGAYGSISNSYASAVVTGQNTVGGLLGAGSANISNSYATGAVNGSSYVGGLVGYNYGNGNISNSYATGAVTGNDNVGGLVGVNFGNISNSYAAGAVTGSSYVGGLVGSNYGTIANGYWNSSLNELNGVGRELGVTTGGAGLSTVDMRTASSFSGFNFTTSPGADGNNWVLVDADGTLNNAGGALGASFPMLASEYATSIDNAHQLQLMAMDLTAQYTLRQNIDAIATNGAVSDVWLGSSFVRIGDRTSAFTGTLDGLGNTISKLTIHRPSSSYLGLFGVNAGAIQNVGLVDVAITGADNLGGLVGLNRGSILNSYVSGTVTGGTTVGGLASANEVGGTISNSYAAVLVSGQSILGGLVGVNDGGAISNSYASGDVTGRGDSIGGFVGQNGTGSTIDNSYSTGAVSSSLMNASHVGGFAGSANAADITNSFWDSQTSGLTSSAGGVGKSTADMQDLATFSGTSPAWDIATDASLGSVYPHLRWATFGLSAGTSVWVIGGPASTSVSYTLSNLNSGYTYNGNPYSLASLWTPSSIFGNTYSSWTPGTDYTFQYSGNTVTGFTNAGSYSGITVNVLKSGFAVANSGNTTGSLTIDPKSLTLSATKDYDRSTALSASQVSLYGLVGNETLTYTGAITHSKNVGSGNYISAITLGDGSHGGLAANYALPTLNAINAPASITAKGLTVTGTTVANKMYDGTTAASLSNGTLVGVVSGDAVSLTQAGSFASKAVGVGKAVTAADSLGGEDSNNYSLTQPGSLTADITAKGLTVSGTTVTNKVYDGTTAASLSNGTLVGVVSGDAVSLMQAGSFASKTAGVGKAVTAADSLSGTDADNYSLTQPGGLTADITAKALTVTGTTVANKMYDGTTAATLSNGTLVGVVTGDAVTLNQAGSFVSKIVGVGKSVTAADSLNGADASNYSLEQPTGLTADIQVDQAANNAVTGALFVSPVSNPTQTGSSSMMNSALSNVVKPNGSDGTTQAIPVVNMPSSISDVFGNGVALTLVSMPSIDAPTQAVSLSEARSMLSGTSGNNNTVTDVRVPVSRNSLAEIVNGGVKLPEGVEQQLFVVEANP